MKITNALLLLASTTAGLSATTIVAVDGATGGFAVGIRPASTIGVTFTVDQTYTDVSIDASLDGTFSGEAYLTTLIGADASVADQVAGGAFTSSGTGFETPLLDDVTLDPGTYYLTLSTSASSGAQAIWGTATPTVVTDTGASTTAGYYIVDFPGYNSAGSYPPSAFGGLFETGDSLEFNVSTPASVPEPESLILILLGAGGLLLGGFAGTLVLRISRWIESVARGRSGFASFLPRSRHTRPETSGDCI